MTETHAIKICTKCKVMKPLIEFYKNKAFKDGRAYECKQCRKAAMKRRYALNREQIIEAVKRHQSEHADHKREYSRQWRERNAESLRLKKRAYYFENVDHRRSLGQQWRQQNSEKSAEYSRKWRERNPEQRRAVAKANKTKRKMSPGYCSPQQWIAKVEYWGWLCYLCGQPLTSATLHMEHRKPLSRGGSHWPANLAPACAACNLRKSNKTEQEFRSIN